MLAATPLGTKGSCTSPDLSCGPVHLFREQLRHKVILSKNTELLYVLYKVNSVLKIFLLPHA